MWFSLMKDFLLSDGDRGVRLSLCGDEGCSGKPNGRLHIRWSCNKTSIEGGDWLRNHELVGDKLEIALCEKLKESLLSEDGSCSTEWGLEYDRVLASAHKIRALATGARCSFQTDKTE